MRFTASEIAAAVGGVLRGDDVEVEGAAIDSRQVEGGELFVPIVAERDGHDFIQGAVAAGAAAYLTANDTHDGAPAIGVDDTASALLDLGRHARTRVPERVVGITGSVGKTTVKDLLRALLTEAYETHASERSFNNELGVPLTLANAPDGVEAVVLEMGARGIGHIDLLCSVGRPTIGVVTTVAAAHTEMFGTVEAIAEAKGELIEALPATGTAVLNAQNPLVLGMRTRAAARVLTFATEGRDADVTASAIHYDELVRPCFRLHSPWGDTDVTLTIPGHHQVANALAAAAAALAAGVPIDALAAGFATTELSPNRMDIRRSPRGLLVLDDAYNANPTSMESALRALAALPAQRRVAVLGVMAELGDQGPEEHRRIAELATELGVDVVAVDVDDYGVPPVDGVDGAEAALEALALGAGDAVLVKGSRVAGLERLAAELRDA